MFMGCCDAGSTRIVPKSERLPLKVRKPAVELLEDNTLDADNTTVFEMTEQF